MQSSHREDEVLRQIEQAVLDHRLPPGTKLKEVQLADLFGVKRGLIRKVLTRLAHSKLVEQTPNRGATVARPSVKEGRDLFAARRVIEAAILDALGETIDASMIESLRAMLAREQAAYLNLDRDHALTLSVNFHRRLAQLAGNGVLEEYLNDVIRRTPLVILTHLGDGEGSRCSNHEHAEVINALESGDIDRAKAVMDQHLRHLERKIEHKSDVDETDLATLLRPQRDGART